MALPSDLKPRAIARGGAATLVSGGYIFDQTETNSNLDGDLWYGSTSRAGIVDQMLKDAHVRMSLQYVTAPLRAASWVFEPGGPSDVEKEAADFCNYAFFERLNFDRFLREALTYKSHGFSLFEVTDDIEELPGLRFPRHPGGGKGLVITGLHNRPAWSTHRFIQSKSNPAELAAWEQYLLPTDADRGGIRRINADRILRFTENQQGALYHGVPTLRSAYGPWFVKRTLSVLEAISHEKNHVGTPRITLPEGGSQEDLDRATTILAEMRSNEKGYLVLPHGYDFAWEGLKGEQTDINSTLTRCNLDIAVNVGAGYMLLGLQTGSGSYGLASSQSGMFELVLETDRRFIVNTINSGSDGWSPVQRLTALNYGPGVAAPRLTVRNMPTRDWSKVLPVVHNLSMSNLITPDDGTEAFIRDVLRLPPQDEGTARPAGGAPELIEETEENE